MIKKILLGSIGAFVLLAGSAYALTVNYGAATDVKNSVNVSSDGVNTTSSNGSSVNIGSSKNGGVKVTGSNGSTVNINSSGGSTKTVNVTVDGKTVNIGSSNGSLKVQVDGGLSSGGKEQVVKLQGDADLMIQSEDDLDTYSNLVVEERPGVKSVTVGDDSVSVSYKQPAKFLGIIPVNLTATAQVQTGGTVKIILPWYSFLFTKNTVAVQTKIQSDLKAETDNGNVDVNLIGKGSSKLQVNSDGNGNSSVTLRSNAHAINVVSGAVNSSVSIGSN